MACCGPSAAACPHWALRAAEALAAAAKPRAASPTAASAAANATSAAARPAPEAAPTRPAATVRIWSTKRRFGSGGRTSTGTGGRAALATGRTATCTTGPSVWRKSGRFVAFTGRPKEKDRWVYYQTLLGFDFSRGHSIAPKTTSTNAASASP